MNYPLVKNSWGIEEHLALARVAASGQYTMGREVRAFEDEFAAKYKTRNAVMVNSGSSANLVGLAAWVLENSIPAGSEIIVPAVSWSTTYWPIHQLGMVPVFVDVDYNWNISPESARAAITDKTRAILAVNLLGMPAQLGVLHALCLEKNIALLEDNCESLGAAVIVKDEVRQPGRFRVQRRYCGTIGEFGTFSFFHSHHMQTMEGGMIVTNNDHLADVMRSMRAHGWTRDFRVIESKVVDELSRKFEFMYPGYCVRPLEMAAAVGRAQLKKIDRFIERRRENAEFFTDRFYGYDHQEESSCSGEFATWFGFGILLPVQMMDRGMVADMLKDAEVETRPIVAGNFTLQPCMKYMEPYRIVGPLTNANDLHKRGLFFGNDHRDLTLQIQHVYELLEDFKYV